MSEHDEALALLHEAWSEIVEDACFPGLDDDLINSDIVDSLVALELVEALEKGLNIEIPDRVLVPEHIQTIRLILTTIDQLEKGQL